MKKQTLYLLMVLLFVICVGSCAFVPFMADLVAPSGSTILTVDSTGAKAVAGTESQSRSGSKALESKGIEDNPALVKFLENGTISSVIDFGENQMWMPAVAFISTGEDGSIYVGFESIIWSWTDGANVGLQFIRIYPDSTDYDVLWPPAATVAGDEFGQIDVWGWWGMEQDPLVKGTDGKLYFKVAEWNATSNSNSVYCYDPVAKGAPVMVTPENATLSISTFMIDAKKHLYIQSAEDWSGNSASFLRYYTNGESSYKNIYYSSGGDMWVRGYVPNPTGDFLVINGQNIRGMNGIIKVSDLDAAELTYDLMYSDANGGGDWINLYKYYDNDWENNTELIDNINDMWDATAYKWRDDVKTSGSVDIDKIYAKIQPYFYGTPAIKAGETAFVTGALDDVDVDSTVDDSRQLYQWIAHYPEEFLTNYFDGVLFKDWLTAHSMTDLYFNNIGTMLWASDGSLYGLYDSGWWCGGDSAGTKVVKLLDRFGNRDLDVVSLDHGDEKPSMIKIEGDYLYYRYAVLDTSNQETGLHQLARLNITTKSEQEILSSDLNNSIEVISYDVSSDGLQLYFVGANPQTNEIINGKIDIASGSWEAIDTTLKFGNIKVIE